ncbi:MAG: hypothetical protein ABFD80_00415 [Acidobacteriota bacterium]
MKDTERSGAEAPRTHVRGICPPPAWIVLTTAARWATALLFFPLIGLFAGWITPGARLTGIAAEHGRMALAIVLVVSLPTVADSFRTLVRRFRHGSSFPLGPSLLVAAG